MTGSENAQVREPARVLVQTSRPTFDSIGREILLRVQCRVLSVQGVDLRKAKQIKQSDETRVSANVEISEGLEEKENLGRRARTMASTPM